MSTYDLTQDAVIHSSNADGDHTILVLDGAAIALVEDGDDECAGYYQEIKEGAYVYNKHEGYSYYLANGELRSMRGEPDSMSLMSVNDGNQEMAYHDSEVAELAAG